MWYKPGALKCLASWGADELFCKQMPVTYVPLGLLQQNKDFPTAPEQANKMMSRFILLVPFFSN